MTHANAAYANWFTSAPDGLRLHLRDYGSPLDPGLAGRLLARLARNAADFAPLAEALAAGAAGRKRRVIAVDYRGRGEPITIQTGGTTTSGSRARIFSRNWRRSKFTRPFLSVRQRGGLHIMALAAARRRWYVPVF